MKKILSVALSTAMAFSMFASVAFGDTAVSPQDKFDELKAKGIFAGYSDDGLAHLEADMTRAEFAKIIVKIMGLQEITDTYTYKDAGYDHPKNWAARYIEAVTAAGVMEGNGQGLFNQKDNVTVQEMATALVKALKLPAPKGAIDNNAAVWAKEDVQSIIESGLGFVTKDTNFQANATRSLLVEAAFAAEALLNVPAVVEATKVASVSANNLKEVVITFDGTVDTDTAEDEANYSLKSGKAVKSASLSEDKKTVTLTLTGVLANNKVDFLNISNIKAGNNVLSEKEYQFSTSDNQLPEVTSVKSLGTKSVKVVFSEPVVLPVEASFELDGKAYFGKITDPTSRTVILTPYNTAALTVGDHKLVIGGVYDFAGFRSLTSTHDITVVEDKDAPTITEASATLETVTVTFSEEVDPDTISASNVYWKSGDSKKTADTFTVVADDKVKFFFTKANSLPTGALPIHVEAVKDYSGNKIADGTTVIVTPEIDQTRPVVKKVVADDDKTIKVTFSKSVLEDSAESRGNYTIKNKDGDVISVKDAELGSNNVVTLTLYTALSTGDNTVTIKNVKDSTRLENTMLDYSGKVNLADVSAPKIDSTLFNVRTGTLIIGFDKKMDPASLQDLANYHVQYGVGTDAARRTLTSSVADITVFNDSNAVAIKFAEDVSFGTQNATTSVITASSKQISALFVGGLKDEAGNLLKEFTKQNDENKIDLIKDITLTLADYDTDHAGYKAALVGKSQINVKLSAGVSTAPASAFTVTNTVTEEVYAVNSVDYNGTSTVKLNFKDSVLNTTYSDNLEVEVDFGKLTTLAGNVSGTGTAKVLDKVAPTFKGDNVTVAGEVLTAEFSEEIVLDNSANLVLLAKDFEITRYYDGKKLVAGNQFTVSLVGTNSIAITLTDDRENATEYTVKFLGSKYLTDTSAAKNEVASFTKDTKGVVLK